MTEKQPAVTLSHPPERLLRMANPTVKALMLTPLMGSLRKQLMLLVVTGRKSGRKYSFPLSAHQIDGVYYALTSAPWKNNFRDGADAILRHAGSTRRVHGELITDPAAVAEISRRCAESYGPKRAQMLMGLKFRDQRRIPTVEEFAEAVSQVGYAAIRLTPTR
ncbi:hypothetical protein ABQF17_07995 [Mycolicibacterium elephantis]|uniref:hypothetical protein n=1 Tax=Mycolicibacterium elephantis TaxID=81858 RepID=UPI000629104B|nr:hypothetical protein [Mycolicibacterium elephantis]KKW65419.1 hypothetical protein AAV95_07105 [Mycolicibacterium elephantis]OBA82741.1 hypothetical protein A5633_15200 [Mycolicibacterium elephantis]OBB18472.1 hypothetical protein A5762_20215 [Mycolicibacterium elephantis]OBE93798.1 hypothetical protein A5776_03575 [Mycolicibacterium elephantis]